LRATLATCVLVAAGPPRRLYALASSAVSSRGTAAEGDGGPPGGSDAENPRASEEFSKAPFDFSKAPFDFSKAPFDFSKAPFDFSKAPFDFSPPFSPFGAGAEVDLAGGLPLPPSSRRLSSAAPRSVFSGFAGGGSSRGSPFSRAARA
jgi:hypothetical protein